MSALSGDVRINQDGVVPSVFDLPTGAKPLAVGITDTSGNQLSGFDPSRPSNSTLSSVAFATGTVTIAAANPVRRGLQIFNATNKPINVALATGASSGSFSFQLPTNGFYESDLNGYTGIVTAFWVGTASTGAAIHVTEITT